MRKNEGLMKIVVVAIVIFALMSVAVPVGVGQEEEGTIKWQWETDSDVCICGTPAIGPDGNIYVTAGVGGMADPWVPERLFCISPQGSMLWKSQELDHCGTSDPVIASDGTIYVVGYYKLYAFNPDGTLKWEWTTPEDWDPYPHVQICGVTLGPDGTIYTANCGSGHFCRYLYAINPDGTVKWAYCNKYIWDVGDLTVGKDGVLYGELDRFLYAFNPDNGAVLWNSTELGSYDNQGGMAVGSDGTIYVPLHGTRKLVAISPDGTIKWEYDMAAGPGIPSIGSDGTIYVTGGKLYALTSSGQFKWTASDGSTGAPEVAIASDGTIYSRLFHSGKGHLLTAVNPDGSIKWTLEIPFEAGTPAIGSDGTIYVTGGCRPGVLTAVLPTPTLTPAPTPAPTLKVNHLSVDGAWVLKETIKDPVVLGKESKDYYNFHGGISESSGYYSYDWTLQNRDSKGNVIETFCTGQVHLQSNWTTPPSTLVPGQTMKTDLEASFTSSHEDIKGHFSCDRKGIGGQCAKLTVTGARGFVPIERGTCVNGYTKELSKKSSETIEWLVPPGIHGDTLEIIFHPFTTGMAGSMWNTGIHFIYEYKEEAPTTTPPDITPTPTPIGAAPTPTPAPPPKKFKECVGDQPYLYVEDRVMGKGKTVEIPIMMCNARDLANMDLDWSYNAAVLKIIDVTKGSLNKKAFFDWNEVSAGKLKIAFASSKGVTGSKNSIAVMKFEVIGNTGDTSTLTGTVTTASKTDGTKITVGVNPGKFTVGTSQIKGDCDGDGKLTVKDALAALQISVGKMALDMCYDYNGDGKVNSADAREMLKARVGKK